MTEMEGYTFYDCGIVHSDKPLWKHSARGFHSRNNLIFVTEGVLYFEENGVHYEVNSGECLLLESRYQGRGYRPSGGPITFFYTLFEGPGEPPFPKHFALRRTEFIRRLHTQLLECAGRYDFPSYAMNSLMRTLFYEILYQSAHRGERRAPVTEDIKNWIYKRQYHNPSVQDVAAHFHFCPDHLSKLFRQHEHMTLQAYLISVKISLINNLLSDSTFSVKYIAKLLSYPNESSMCKFYKYHTGITPSVYRSRLFKGVQSQKQPQAGAGQCAPAEQAGDAPGAPDTDDAGDQAGDAPGRPDRGDAGDQAETAPGNAD